MKVGTEFRVGTIIAPKKGSIHHKMYGDFVGVINRVSGDTVYWEVLEEGLGEWPIVLGKNNVSTSGTDDFKDITEIYNSPLWKALG